MRSQTLRALPLGIALAGWLTPTVVFAQLMGGNQGQGGAGGIYLDAKGVVRAAEKETGKIVIPKIAEDLARRADLRQVSLKAIAKALGEAVAADSKKIPDELRYLAGLNQLTYIVFDRSDGDIRLVGPAEGWRVLPDGRPVSRSTNRPLLQLDDLIVALRTVFVGTGEATCSLDPQPHGVAAIRKLNDEMKMPESKTAAEETKAELAAALDLQIARTGGVPSGSRASLMMLDADYRMKRMALGLEKLTGVANHLDSAVLNIERGTPTTSMARWWFTPKYEGIAVDPTSTTFQLRGQGLQLLNEEMLVDASGKGKGTGRAVQQDRFSKQFTEQFPIIERKHPCFADLHNFFDLMVLSALMKRQDRAGWLSDSILLDGSKYEPTQSRPPTHAEPVIAVRYVPKGRKGVPVYAFAFGGVAMNPQSVVDKPLIVDGNLAVPTVPMGEKSGDDAIALAAKRKPLGSLAPLAEGKLWGDIVMTKVKGESP